jgi:quinol-cytochrome oxidoreductase complex cytochrome b subunit
MKSRIITGLICLVIGGVIAVFIINPWQSQETAKNISYVIKTDNNWFYVCSQFLLMSAFIVMGILYGVKDDRRKTQGN